MCFFKTLKLILIKGVIKTHLNPSLMITLDHSWESSILTFHISYIEDIACFKFGGSLRLENFSSLNYLVLVFFFNLLCILVSFICLQFLGYIYIYFSCFV